MEPVVRVLLDTHALIWFAFDNPKLSEAAKNAILLCDNEVLVSAASAWPLTTKVRSRKLPGGAKFAHQIRIKARDWVHC